MLGRLCTSSPGDRFPDKAEPQAIDDWVEALRDYLQTHLAAASACILLITERSLARGSGAVAWEIQEGTRLARQGGVRFIPCMLGVSVQTWERHRRSVYGGLQQSEFGPVEGGAPEIEYQGLRVDGKDPMPQLVSELVKALTSLAIK